MGIDILSQPASNKLNEKANMKKVWDVIALAFAKGTALGYHFHSRFEKSWEQECRMQPDSEWQDARTHGLALPRVQPTLPLNKAVAIIAEMALGWDAEQSHRLDSGEIQFLKSLLADNDTRN